MCPRLSDKMVFTYKGYRELLELLAANGYEARDYSDYYKAERCVILRHDIDCDPRDALRIGEIERSMNVSSTYLVLLTSGLYNPFSAESLKILRELQSMGHHIGLHFDEKAYEHGFDAGMMTGEILKEASVLQQALGTPVTVMSMHRPSRETLEADLEIPGMVNTYSKTFFNQLKYLSDSRRRWREPVEEIISSGRYERLQILTHPFWYGETEISLAERLRRFVDDGNADRYRLLKNGITDFENAIRGE